MLRSGNHIPFAANNQFVRDFFYESSILGVWVKNFCFCDGVLVVLLGFDSLHLFLCVVLISPEAIKFFPLVSYVPLSLTMCDGHGLCKIHGKWCGLVPKGVLASMNT